MKQIRVGDTVIIRDALNPDYIGKAGTVEAISHNPNCCKLTIEGMNGSWACAWLFSQIEKL